jgi:hypothetical protein
MNRHDRRRQASIAKHNRFFNDHVRHLPEAGPEILSRPGVRHVVFTHDEQCAFYDRKPCNCEPQIRIFAEPERA